jgi:RNA polymerase sigma-70 factor, ECF subfamily
VSRSFPPHLLSLLERAQSGNTDALGALFEAFRPYLFVLAKRERRGLTRSKFGDSDLVQDTFKAAYEEFKTFRGRSADELLAWLHRILERLSLNQINHFKQVKRDVGRERPLVGPHVHVSRQCVGHEDYESPCDLSIREERLQLAWQALLRLPSKYREVIELHYRNGESFESIALRLHLTAEAARKRWTRGLVMWQRVVSQLQEKSDQASLPG